MKGILLSGGAGSRLYPLSLVASKQLQPVYDKPMIYYPLTTLIQNGIDEICLISTPQDLPRFASLLGDGKRFGIKLEYREQEKPNGIAQAFTIAESFIREKSVCLILGDNIFSGAEIFQDAFRNFIGSATIFGCEVKDPQRYGVLGFSTDGRVESIEEKPKNPKSRYAVPGIYLYGPEVVGIARNLQPSQRGEYEITDVNREYLRRGLLNVIKIPVGAAWLDAGTSSSLQDASDYVRTIETRHGVKIGCPEEAAFNRGMISKVDLKQIVERMPSCEYREYLERVLER